VSASSTVCGWYGQLTFEHVPPHCAFNSSPARTYTLDQWMLFDAGETAQWENDQRGSGYFALCDKCNNERGGKWYVPEFQEWAHVGADIVQEAQQHPQYDDLVAVNLTMRRSYPVRFVKQVVLMLLARSIRRVRRRARAASRVRAQARSARTTRRYRLFLGLYDHPVARHAGCYHPVCVDENGITGFAATDILYPPYSYTLTIDEPTEASRDGEITHLAELGYDEQKDVSMRLAYNRTLLPHDVGSPDRAEP
jgi:hypothetical protein